MPMKALALDFDGVIFDSAPESFRVALNTYLELRPDSSLSDSTEVFDTFVEHMPLGNRSEDYAVILDAIEQEAPLPDQAAYDRLRDAHDPDFLDRYHERYYQIRHQMAEQTPEIWHGLMRPYAPLIEILRRRQGDSIYAMATAKDRRAVDALLAHHGLEDLFPAQWITDKETGKQKSAHLTRLSEILGLPFERMTFVDDKINHLEHVAPLGVRCALAAWGYNGPREETLAAERGYLVSRLDSLEEQWFGR